MTATYDPNPNPNPWKSFGWKDFTWCLTIQQPLFLKGTNGLGELSCYLFAWGQLSAPRHSFISTIHYKSSASLTTELKQSDAILHVQNIESHLHLDFHSHLLFINIRQTAAAWAVVFIYLHVILAYTWSIKSYIHQRADQGKFIRGPCKNIPLRNFWCCTLKSS